MNLKMLFAKTMIVGSALCVLAPRAAHANEIGSWAGYSKSSVVAGPFHTSEFDVLTETSKGGFTGRLTLAMGDGSVRFLCDGSVAPSNVISFEGKTSNGLIIVVCRGKIAEFADGSVHFAALEYSVTDSNTSLNDNGYLAVVHRSGGLNWANLLVPAVQGNWRGPWASDDTRGQEGPAYASITTHVGSSFAGAVEFDVASSTGLAVSLFKGNLQGTMTLPAVQDGASDTLLLAVDNSRGSVAILTGLLLPAVQKEHAPAQLQGTALLYHSLADVYRGVWNGTNTFYDRGAYQLPAVQ